MGRNFDRATSTPFADALAYNNLVINGGMDVSQENGTTQITLANNTAKYVVDMWLGYYNHAAATAVFKSQQVVPPGAPSFGLAFPNCLQMTATTASAMAAAGDFANFTHYIEGYRWAKLGYGNTNAQWVTIGFWVYATIAGTATAAVRNNVGNRSYLANFNVNSPLTWEYKTVNVPGDQAGTWITNNGVSGIISFCFGAGSTYQGTPGVWQVNNLFATSSTTNFFATSGNTVCVTGVSVMPGTEGPTAAKSPFAIRPFDQERLLSQRYWQSLNGFVAETAAAFQAMRIIPMRAAPTIAGGGAGFTIQANDGNTLAVSQTSRAFQNLTLDARL